MIRYGLIASGVMLATTLGLTLWVWNLVPDDASVAIHWNMAGEADGFASKSVALLVLPVAMALASALTAALPRIDPRRGKLQRSRRAYMVGWLGTLSVLLAAHAFIVLSAAGAEPPISVVLVAVAVLVIALGNAMAKSRSNWFVGIRTPWSLSSEDAWIASHRVGGWGFVVSGVLGLLGLLHSGQTGITLLLAGIFTSIALAVVVSYRVWRRDTA